MKNRVSCSFSTLLFIVFLILKLTDVVDWSWWWVTSPLWIPVCVGFTIFSITALIVLIKSWKENK